MLKSILYICTLVFAAVTLPNAVAQTHVKLSPVDRYSSIPTRSEALAEQPVLKPHRPGERPKIQRTPHETNTEDSLRQSEANDNLSMPETMRPQVLDSVFSSIDSKDNLTASQSALKSGASVETSTRIQPIDDFATLIGEGTFGHYEPKLVDLRPFLPAPGKQQKQNCVAWAIGYASYSCQVCQQRQGDKPDKNHEIFSPSFIYNQLCGDSDTGLHVCDVVDFIMKNGCSTLQTMPIKGDGLPDASAKTEAQLYRAISHQKATGIKDIRGYLQDGFPVILVVRQDAELQSGKFDEIYEWDVSKMTEHISPHAVCAVGYDDDRKAVLVMNSLGSEWNDDGFFWVSYDTLQTIPTSRGGRKADGKPVRDNELPYWCVEAHVIMVKESSPTVSLCFDSFDVPFQVKDEMVFNGELLVTFDVNKHDDWRIEDVAANDDTIFLLRHDHTVIGLDNKTDFVFKDVHPRWRHFTSGIPRNSKVTMIAAATNTPLFALTNDGVLLRRDSKGGVWKSAQVPDVDGVTFEDLRDQRGNQITASTSDGRNFRFAPGAGWQALLPDKN